MIEPAGDAAPIAAAVDPLQTEATIAGLLGAITASCMLVEEPKRAGCYKSIEPWEEPGKELNPQEVVREFITQHGAEPLERSIELLKELVEKTKQELKAP